MHKKETRLEVGDVITLKFEVAEQGPHGKCDGCYFKRPKNDGVGDCLDLFELTGLPSCKFRKIVYKLKK